MTRSTLVHSALFGLGLIILLVLYLHVQNITAAALGVVVLILAHLVVFGGLLFMGRNRIIRTIQK